MSMDLGALAGRLTLDATQWQDGLQKASASFSQTTAEIKSSSAGVGQSAAALEAQLQGLKGRLAELAQFRNLIDPSAMGPIDAAMQETNREIAGVEAQLQTMAATARTSGQALAQSFAGANPQIQQLGQQLRGAQTAHVAHTTAVRDGRLAIQEWNAVASVMGTHVPGLSQGMQALNTAVGGVSVALIGMAAGAAAVGAAVAASVASFAEYQTSLLKIQALTGTSAEEVAKFGVRLRELALSGSISAKELADGLYYIGSAGFKGAEAMEVLEATQRMAAAGFGSFTNVADATTSVLKAYRLSASDAGKVTDILAASIIAGKIEADTFAKSIGMVLPVAAALKVPIDQVGAAIAVMTNNGLSSAEATTALKNILGEMLHPTEQGQKALAAMGLTYAQLRDVLADPSQGLPVALKMINDRIGDNIESLGKIIPDIRGLTGMLSLGGENAAEFNRILGETANAQGRVGEAAKVTATGIEYQMKVMQNRFTELGLSIGGFLIGALDNLSGRLQNQIPTSGQHTIDTLDKIATGADKAMSALDKLAQTRIRPQEEQKPPSAEEIEAYIRSRSLPGSAGPLSPDQIEALRASARGTGNSMTAGLGTDVGAMLAAERAARGNLPQAPEQAGPAAPTPARQLTDLNTLAAAQAAVGAKNAQLALDFDALVNASAHDREAALKKFQTAAERSIAELQTEGVPNAQAFGTALQEAVNTGNMERAREVIGQIGSAQQAQTAANKKAHEDEAEAKRRETAAAAEQQRQAQLRIRLANEWANAVEAASDRVKNAIESAEIKTAEANEKLEESIGRAQASRALKQENAAQAQLMEDALNTKKDQIDEDLRTVRDHHAQELEATRTKNQQLIQSERDKAAELNDQIREERATRDAATREERTARDAALSEERAARDVELGSKRSVRDVNLANARAEADAQSAHSLRLAEIQKKGGPGAAEATVAENASFALSEQHAALARQRATADRVQKEKDAADDLARKQADAAADRAQKQADAAADRARKEADITADRARSEKATADQKALAATLAGEEKEQARVLHAQEAVLATEKARELKAYKLELEQELHIDKETLWAKEEADQIASAQRVYDAAVAAADKAVSDARRNAGQELDRTNTRIGQQGGAMPLGTRSGAEMVAGLGYSGADRVGAAVGAGAPMAAGANTQVNSTTQINGGLFFGTPQELAMFLEAEAARQMTAALETGGR